MTPSPNQSSARNHTNLLTLAISNYDRHAPLIEGTVTVPNVPLTVMDVGQTEVTRHGSRRHERMLNNQEFDIAEVSLSSYLIALDQGAPFIAIPIFPRRLFSISQMWIRKDSDISTPKDLHRRRIGLNTFQTTLSVLAKADLSRVYGVPWREITWVTQRDETKSFKPDPAAKLERLSPGESLVDAIMAGRLDAIMIPHPSHSFLENTQLVRLIKDPISEETRYFKEYGYFPIMHVVIFREEVLKKSPGLAQAVFEAFELSSRVARERWDDPNWSIIAWGRQALERQQKILADNIWPNGLEKNLDNLSWFIDQSYDQGLIHKPFHPSKMFHPSVLEA